MPVFGIRGREEPLAETLFPGVSEKISGFVDDVGGATFDGVDAAAGNVISDPNPKTITELGRDLVIEAFPGEQKTSLDIDYGEGNIKTAGYLRDQGPVKTGIKSTVQTRAGDLRDTALEKGANYGVRKAAQALLPALGRSAAKNTLRAAAGGLSSGPAAPLVTGALGVWVLVDTVDTGLTVATGKGLSQFEGDGKSFGDSGYYRGSIADNKIIEEKRRRQNETRPFGSDSTLGGQPVKWGGDDYGWQSPESFKNIRRY